MRTLLAGLVVFAACSHSTGPAAPAAERSRADAALYPASYPSLRDAERATDPQRADRLARIALQQLGEEHDLSSRDPDHERAYERLLVRARIAQDHALITTGHGLEALADVVKRPFPCPASPQGTRETCESLAAALAVAFPNVIPGQGRVAQVDHALVIDEATSEEALIGFLKKASSFQGSVVQRMRVTSVKPGVLKIGAWLQLRISSNQRLGGGDLVWVAFEPHSIRRTGKTWDFANAHVLFVEDSRP